MQRQIIYLLWFVTYSFIVIFSRQLDVHAQLSIIDNTSPTITQDIHQVVDTSDIQSPLRDGSFFGIKSPNGQNSISVINIGKILTFWQAKNQTLNLIYNIINYLLWFTSLVVFVYLIYEWYKVVVAGTDEEAYKEAVKKVKNAAIALVGIALSRFIVSMIFYILNAIGL